MARPYAVCTLFVGVGRSGKTYAMVKEIVDEILPNETCTIWHNLPVYAEKIADHVAKKTGKPREEYLARLKAIPEEKLTEWRGQMSGPWDFFSEETGNSILNSRIFLDEAHHYWPETSREKWQARWQVWVGELGHANASIRFLTQDLGKLAEGAQKECAMRYLITNSESERDPWFKVLLGDWYELYGAMTGQWIASCWIREDRKVFTRQEHADWTKHRFSQTYFDLYDSHSKPVAGGQAVSSDYKRLYKLHSLAWIVSWFLRRNGYRFAVPAVKLAFVVYLCSGGIGHFFGWVMGSAREMAGVNFKEAKPPVVAKKKAADVAGNVPPMDSNQSPNMIPDLAFQEQALQSRLALANEQQRAELLAERDRLRSEVAAGSEVGALFPDLVLFRDGTGAKVGEVLEGGFFRGRTVAEILFDRREVRLDDGSLLRVGWKRERMPVASYDETGKSGPDIPAGVQPVGTVRPAGTDGAASGGAGDGLGRRNANRGASPSPGTNTQVERGFTAEPRRADNHSGSKGPDFARPDGNDLPAFRRQRVPLGERLLFGRSPVGGQSNPSSSSPSP